MKNKARLIGLIMIILIVGGLFVSSSMTYHQQTSVPFLRHYLAHKPFYKELNNICFIYGGKVESIQAVGYFKFIEFFIRKFAHFSVFGLLGIATFLFLKDEMKHRVLSPWISWFTVTGWAGFDEFHESLTGGRTPLVQDVMLDSTGAFCGICLTILVIFIWRRFLRKH